MYEIYSFHKFLDNAFEMYMYIFSNLSGVQQGYFFMALVMGMYVPLVGLIPSILVFMLFLVKIVLSSSSYINSINFFRFALACKLMYQFYCLLLTKNTPFYMYVSMCKDETYCMY